MPTVSSRRPKLTIVVNPRSGRGRAGRLLPKVSAELIRCLPEVSLRVRRTTSYADAREQALQVVAEAAAPEPGQRPDILVMMGGDGMASLGINACANSHVQLGIIPAGTGDDFARGMGLPREPLAAARVVAAGVARQVDLALVSGDIADGSSQRYVGCIVSSGYDAKVNHRVNSTPHFLGQFNYGWAVLTEIAKLRALNYRVVIDGQPRELAAILIAVANAGYFGGGIHMCPNADPTDGLLDLTIIGPASRWDLIRLFPKLFRSDFIEHPAISYMRAKEVILDGDGLIPMADGEDLGSVPLRITSAPAVLSLLVGGEAEVQA